jgi:hypothetical protein
MGHQPSEAFVERVRVDQRFAGADPENALDRWKAMRRAGWDLEVLIEHRLYGHGRRRQTGMVVAVGCRR